MHVGSDMGLGIQRLSNGWSFFVCNPTVPLQTALEGRHENVIGKETAFAYERTYRTRVNDHSPWGTGSDQNEPGFADSIKNLQTA